VHALASNVKRSRMGGDEAVPARPYTTRRRLAPPPLRRIHAAQVTLPTTPHAGGSLPPSPPAIRTANQQPPRCSTLARPSYGCSWRDSIFSSSRRGTRWTSLAVTGGRRVRRNPFVWSGGIFSGRPRLRAAASANSARIEPSTSMAAGHPAQFVSCPVPPAPAVWWPLQVVIGWRPPRSSVAIDFGSPT
jgi:hypothetical protein